MKKIYIIVDSEIQKSLYKFWIEAFKKKNYDVKIFNFEKKTIHLLKKLRLGFLERIYKWSRSLKNRYFFQSFLVYLIKPIKKILIKKNNEELINLGIKKKDIVFVFKGSDLLPETLINFANKNIRTVCLNGDHPFNMYSSNDLIIKSLQLYTLYITWSLKIGLELKNYGLKNIYYLPFACNKIGKYIKTKWIHFDLKDYLVFVGDWDQEREFLINNIKYKKILVIGPNWQKRKKFTSSKITYYEKRISPEEAAYIYKNSLACLNLLRKQNKESHNMKSFEIPSAGGFMLAPKTKEHLFFFKNCKSVILFNNISEIPVLLRKIYLISVKKRKKFLLNTKKWIIHNHSYDQRVKKLLKKLSKL